MRIIGVIPARWASTRLPGKSLVPLGGKPMIVRVLERARGARLLESVWVATDDERIADVVRGAGGRAVMTRPDHPSGTDRIAEAAAGTDADIIVNIQGDEPLMDPTLIDGLVSRMTAEPEWDMGTAAAPLTDADALRDPAVVKVVRDGRGQALYFSRAPIPFVRDAPGTVIAGLHWRHLGLYAYRAAFLQRLVAAAPCAVEQAEKLEQLRALHLGARMLVMETAAESIGVDTAADAQRVDTLIREREDHGQNG